MFKVHHPYEIDNMNSLYVPMFQIMDIANQKQLPCILKDIFNQVPNYEEIKQIISNTCEDVEFYEVLDELQKDVDLILTEGFQAFETKIKALFDKIEEDDKKWNTLMTKIDECKQKINNLNDDTMMLDSTNE
jgi:peptidoglycan hydrolase CwlO-like protein